MRFVYMAVAFLTMLGVASAQQTGTLRVKVNPGRTGVFVDGKYVGPAKNLGHTRRYKLAAGEHEQLVLALQEVEVVLLLGDRVLEGDLDDVDDAGLHQARGGDDQRAGGGAEPHPRRLPV